MDPAILERQVGRVADGPSGGTQQGMTAGQLEVRQGDVAGLRGDVEEAEHRGVRRIPFDQRQARSTGTDDGDGILDLELALQHDRLRRLDGDGVGNADGRIRLGDAIAERASGAVVEYTGDGVDRRREAHLKRLQRGPSRGAGPHEEGTYRTVTVRSGHECFYQRASRDGRSIGPCDYRRNTSRVYARIWGGWC